MLPRVDHKSVRQVSTTNLAQTHDRLRHSTTRNVFRNKQTMSISLDGRVSFALFQQHFRNKWCPPSLVYHHKSEANSEVKELSTLSGPLLQGCCSEASRVFLHWLKWKSSEIKGKALLGCLATCMYLIGFNMNITIVFQGSWTMQLWTQGEPGIFSHASDVKGRPFILITWVMSGGCMVDVWGEGEFHLQTMH